MKRAIATVLGFLGIAGVIFTPSASLALTFTNLAALGGNAWIPSEDTCFATPSTSNRVTNTGCSGGHAWLVPLSVAVVQSNPVFVSFRASAAGSGSAAQCKYVVRSVNDGAVSAGSLASVSGSNVGLGSFVVQTDQTVHIDCVLFQNGFGLTSVGWSS
jgi:hypothetical protein